MDNNQINSLVDTPINDPNSISDAKSVNTSQPINPEGISLNIETPLSTEQKLELHPEVEGKIEEEKATTEHISNENDTSKNNNINPTGYTQQPKEPESINIVNKTTPQGQDHPLETIDRLSILADEDEKDFISNVKAAHEHT